MSARHKWARLVLFSTPWLKAAEENRRVEERCVPLWMLAISRCKTRKFRSRALFLCFYMFRWNKTVIPDPGWAPRAPRARTNSKKNHIMIKYALRQSEVVLSLVAQLKVWRFQIERSLFRTLVVVVVDFIYSRWSNRQSLLKGTYWRKKKRRKGQKIEIWEGRINWLNHYGMNYNTELENYIQLLMSPTVNKMNLG